MKRIVLLVFLVISIFMNIYGKEDYETKLNNVFDEQNVYKMKQVQKKDNIVIITINYSVDAIGADYTFLSMIAEKIGFINFKIVEEEKQVNEVEIDCNKEFKRIEKIKKKYEGGKYEQYFKKVNQNEVLSEEDFQIFYKNKFYVLKERVFELEKELGIVEDELDINVVTDNIFAYQLISLEKKGIKLNALNCDDDMPITGIEIKKTKRGIKVGDSYEKLVEKYGKENISVEIEGLKFEPEKIYLYKNKELHFILNNRKISQIFIEIDNPYQKIYK